ncbi:MAG: hypothetical protein WD577_03925 [Bacteroidales bacterium]
MNKLFLSCLKATELVEKKMHFGLTAKERVQLKMHKLMCDVCSSYEKQSVFLEKGISLQQHEELSSEDLQHLKLGIHEKLSEMK